MKCKEKTRIKLQKILYDNDYMKTVFPEIKEQKPGKDLYSIAAVI